MNKTGSARILFITGTDTGVGKTLLTGLLLRYLRQLDYQALAMKPFCSGSRADIRLLSGIQNGELTPDDIAPFFFAEPVAPLVATRKHHRNIRLPEVLRHIRRVAKRCDWLLIEGIGGLLVPLGEGFTVRDLIAQLGCQVILVARNRVGTINHTLLSGMALQHVGIERFTTVLMTLRRSDPSTSCNCHILTELLAPNPVFSIGYLGRHPLGLSALERMSKKTKKTLARILACSIVGSLRSL